MICSVPSGRIRELATDPDRSAERASSVPGRREGAARRQQIRRLQHRAPQQDVGGSEAGVHFGTGERGNTPACVSAASARPAGKSSWHSSRVYQHRCLVRAWALPERIMVASQRSRLSLEPAAPRRNENLPARQASCRYRPATARSTEIVDAALIWARQASIVVPRAREETDGSTGAD